jgi:hypothetical protein
VWVKNARRSGSGTASQVKRLANRFMALPQQRSKRQHLVETR